MRIVELSKPHIGTKEIDAVLEVLHSGMVVQGEKTLQLENLFKKQCEVNHAIATSSGTTALQVTLQAYDIGHGDEVITTAFTFMATVNSIFSVGARPVFVDIDEHTFNIDPSRIEAAITKRTKAILPVHLYGLPCQMETIQKLAAHYNLALIEDAAQAVGAVYKGRPAGSFGTGCFSLYATKNIMSIEGGMITTNDGEIAEKCRLIRNHGMRIRYHHEMIGSNYRISDVHAAIGIAQFDQLHTFTERRKYNASFFNKYLDTIHTPQEFENSTHVWHQYTLRIPEMRDDAAKKLKEAGIGTGIFYPIPAHKQTSVRSRIGDISLPITEKLSREVLSLPVHPSLCEEDLNYIVEQVNLL